MIVEALMAIAPTAIGTRTIPHQPPVREGDDCRGNSDVEKDRGRTIRQGLSPKADPLVVGHLLKAGGANLDQSFQVRAA